jgi:hypothetical protein
VGLQVVEVLTGRYMCNLYKNRGEPTSANSLIEEFNRPQNPALEFGYAPTVLEVVGLRWNFLTLVAPEVV